MGSKKAFHEDTLVFDIFGGGFNIEINNQSNRELMFNYRMVEKEGSSVLRIDITDGRWEEEKA